MRLALQQTITASWCAHYLQSRKVLVSVVWITSSVARSHWTRHRPTAAAGRLHTITSRELGPVAHARPPSMAYAPLSPYDRPLPCHQTRAANSSSTLLSFASDPEIGKGCDLSRVFAKAQPHHICYQRIVHELLATYLDDHKPLRPDSLEQTKRLFPSAQPHLSRDTLPLFSSHHMHAFRRAIPGFPPTAFGAPNNSRV